VHARQHPIDVTPVQGLDDLAHQLHGRLHEHRKYRAADSGVHSANFALR
jgi:hypothetical protein